MKHFSKITIFCIVAALVLIPGGSLFAQDVGSLPSSDAGSQPGSDVGSSPGSDVGTKPGTSFKIDNPFTGGNSLIDLLNYIINNIVLPIGVTVAVFFLIYAGFLFVTAQGNETKLQKAKSTFLWTVVGAAILLGAWTIAQAIAGTLCEITNVPGLCTK